MLKSITIYALLDPDTLEVRYVGQSEDAEKRFKGHLQDKKNLAKWQWICTLRSQNKLPLLKIIKTFSPPTNMIQYMQEEKLIAKAFISAGNRLFNSPRLVNTTSDRDVIYDVLFGNNENARLNGNVL